MDEVKGWLGRNKIIGLLGGLGLFFVLIAGGWWYQSQNTVEVEVIKASEEGVSKKRIYVDVAGAVVSPGVYEASGEARIKDVLALAGGLSEEADREYVGKKLNLATKVSDGMKVYIPKVKESVGSSGGGQILGAENGLVNINEASLEQLMGLSGVGEVRAKAIIDGRPYGKIEELKERKIIPESTYVKISGEISVY